MQTGVALKSLPMKRKSLGVLQRAALRRVHPSSIFIRAAAAVWIFPLIWQHDWQNALLLLLFAATAASLVTLNVDFAGMSGTALGRLAFLHLHPLNLTLQSAGALALVWGLWMQHPVAILSATSLLLLGHCFGWEGYDKRLALKEQ